MKNDICIVAQFSLFVQEETKRKRNYFDFWYGNNYNGMMAAVFFVLLII
jgi:hypothetical protein